PAACAACARRALDGDLLLGEAGSRAGFHCCVRAWIFTDHFAETQAAIAAMREDPAVRGSLRLLAGAAWYAAELAQRTGRIADAENEARLALGLTPDDVNLFTGGAMEILVWALAEGGACAERTRRGPHGEPPQHWRSPTRDASTRRRRWRLRSWLSPSASELPARS